MCVIFVVNNKVKPSTSPPFAREYVNVCVQVKQLVKLARHLELATYLSDGIARSPALLMSEIYLVMSPGTAVKRE